MDFSLFRAGHKVQRGASRWMLYFMAMLGSASGQETLVDYWFLWGDEKAAIPGGDASRVIRVEGAKGEHYVPVYEDMHCHPLVAQARAGLNARMRQEALKLSRQYRDAGMSPGAAYEKAWAEVYQRFRSQSSQEEVKETLLQLVARTQAAGAGVSATDAAVQHVLQLLVLHEELLETAEARELLDYLSRQQLIFEKEAPTGEPGTNDALMVLFADAMVHGMKGANAFRDAQFKLNRERIIHHELTGYRAPWGAGLGSRINYRQASRKKVIAATTLGSGTLKTALPDEEEKEKQQEQEEEKKVITASGEAENNGPKPVYMGPPSGGGDGPARFALVRAAEPVAADDATADLSVASKSNAALYFTSGDTVTGQTVVSSDKGSGNTNNRNYTVETQGSYKGPVYWKTTTGKTSVSYWVGDANAALQTDKNKVVTDSSSNTIAGNISLIDLSEGASLYLGGSANYGGTLRIVSGSGDYATLGGYAPTQATCLVENLAGSGNLLLRGYNTSGSTNFTINSSTFAGTLYMVADGGGYVRVNLEGEQWGNTLIDFTPPSGVATSAFGTSSNADSPEVLNLNNHTSLKGLRGGGTNSSVLLNGYTLSLGPAKDDDYTYSSALISSDGLLIKKGDGTQRFAKNVETNGVQVDSGTLHVGGDLVVHSLAVNSGAVLTTAAGVDADVLELHGGAIWNMGEDVNSSSSTVNLYNLQDGAITLKALDSTTWTAAAIYDFANSGLSSYDSALFWVQGGVALNLGNSLTFSNVGGEFSAGDTFALYYGNSSSLAGYDGQSVSINLNGLAWSNSSYVWDAASTTLLVKLDTGTQEPIEPDPDPEPDPEPSTYRYVWSGVSSGESAPGCAAGGMVLGNEWRADGSAENAGWHEQAVSGADAGVYVNGNAVLFRDTDVHGNSETTRDVIIHGAVAPGSVITVDADAAAGSSGSGDALLQYGYALIGTGTITDYKDKLGNLISRTSISQEGSAMLVLNTANSFSGGVTLAEGTSLYLGCDRAAGTGTINMGENTTLYVNYRSDDLNFRTPAVSNALVLAGETAIRAGTGSYGEDRMPSDWRMLTLSGGISGSGTLSLYGYSYLVKPTAYEDRLVSFNYVSAFAINERDAVAAGGGKPSRFTGTVYLKNEFNGRPDNVQEIPVNKNKILAGALQLTLVDDVFSEATLNLTRDKSIDRTAGHNQAQTGAAGKPSTSDNILVLSDNSQIRIKALEADFLGHGFKLNYRDNNESNYIPITAYISDYEQEEERWVVRVVTDGSTNLVLEDDSSAVHKFAGSMGFAHSYTEQGQAYIYAAGSSTKAETVVLAPSEPGGGSLGSETLSLEKRGSSTQYIHSAHLQELSVVEGTVGFNHLSLAGNLNIVGGAELQLSSATNAATGWENITDSGYNSTSNLAITSGNQVMVATLPDTGTVTRTATVEGSLTLLESSSLSFYIMDDEPSSSSANPHLFVSDTLTLQHNTPVAITLTDSDFSLNIKPKYYLASAKTLNVQGGSFQEQMVPLGYGYYGMVKVEDEFLVLTIVGDPRRTWSGMVDYISDTHKDYEWYSTAYTPEQLESPTFFAPSDNRWKENYIYQPGQVVLFGNLYEPKGWTANGHMDSKQTVIVDGAKPPHPGTLVGETDEGKNDTYAFQIDDISVESLGTGENATRADGYQAVWLSGRVTPMSVVINSSYTMVNSDGSSSVKEDGTNYYFYGDGCIADADPADLKEAGFDDSWKTNLRKMGLGTAVIATGNTYSGGTIIEGGRLVMQHIHALGSGEINMFNPTGNVVNIPILQGDFADTDKEEETDDWTERVGKENLSAYMGEGMTTTTIHNTVNVTLQVDEQGSLDASRTDARIANAHDKKLVLKNLKGDLGTVLTLYGSSLSESESNHHDGKYTYAVFKVLDPSEFYGTIKMDGNLWGEAEGTNGGNVQMEIMTTTKSSNGADWLHSTVDLSIQKGTNRTVLALDALGTSGSPQQQTAQVDSLNGGGNGGGRINSSVLSMSQDQKVTLELEGMVAGDYDGVLGFGDFQKTVDYNATQTSIGTVQHHYGGKGTAGELNVRKLGMATQSVNSAWLNRLSVGYRLAQEGENADADGEILASQSSGQRATQAGGSFVVDEALVVSDLKIADGTHVVVGDFGQDATYALTVGDGGVLAFDQPAGDALAKIGAGIPKRTQEIVIPGSNGEEDSIAIMEVAPERFVLLADGATVSAYGDWYTNRVRTETVNGVSQDIEVGIDIATGATVTFNSHNYTPDASISAANDVFGRYNQSYVIQLLGAMSGRDVNLIFNNELISEAAQQSHAVTISADGTGYAGAAGTEMGHVAIRDIHQFTGDITVKDMTALQVNQSNTAANAEKADIEVTVSGKNGALQFVDGVTDQYINQVNLEQGGHVLFGGELQESRTGWKSLDQTQVEVDIAHREGKPPGSINNLDLVKHTSNKSISIGGTAATPAVAANVHITSRKTAEAYNALELLDTHLQGSIVELHEACRLDIADAVVVDRESVVRASVADGGIDTSAIAVNPEMLQANLNVPDVSELGNKVSTSVGTVVQMSFTGHSHQSYTVGSEEILVVQADQLQGVDVTGGGLTLQIHDDTWYTWVTPGTRYMAVQMGGGSGQFHYEVDNTTASASFGSLIGSQFVLQDKDGNTHEHLYWVTSTEVSEATGTEVSPYLLYFAVNIPEPATATLSLLALAGLCARRRRK